MTPKNLTLPFKFPFAVRFENLIEVTAYIPGIGRNLQEQRGFFVTQDSGTLP